MNVIVSCKLIVALLHTDINIGNSSFMELLAVGWNLNILIWVLALFCILSEKITNVILVCLSDLSFELNSSK